MSLSANNKRRAASVKASFLELPVLTDHVREWGNCHRCEIGCLAFKHVFFRGTVPCDVCYIGEGPGKTEDVTGIPFIGRAGKLLDKWIAAAGNRSNCITNTVLCRPTDRRDGPNRPPTSREVSNCHPRLMDFLQKIARPKVIVALGTVAYMQTSDLDVPRLDLRHPAYILRLGGDDTAINRIQVAKLVGFLKKELG